MVYLPRHNRHKKKKSYLGIVFISISFVLLGAGIYKFREIQILFSSDGRSKLSRLEKKITEELGKNQLSEDLAKDYSKAANSFLTMDMINPEAFYFLALSGFYETNLNESEIQYSRIPLACVNGKNLLLPESKSFMKSMEKMYKDAKRANAFGLNSENSESNNFMILYYEIFRSSKKKEILAKEFSSLQKEKLSPNVVPIYKKLGLFSACAAGDSLFLEKLLEDQAGSGSKELSPNDVAFLRGVSFYNSNEYVKGLDALRKLNPAENPALANEAKILEAMIFFKQNLHEKALEILERQYEASEKKDQEILKKIQLVVASRKGLKSKFVTE